MKPVKVGIAAAILLTVFVTLNYNTTRMENIYRACLGTYSDERTLGMVSGIVDPQRYCGCFVDEVPEKKDLQFADITPCLERHVRPAADRLCSANARMREEIGRELDCGCFYDKFSRFMWVLQADPSLVVTPAEKERISNDILTSCSRSVSLEGVGQPPNY